MWRRETLPPIMAIRGEAADELVLKAAASHIRAMSSLSHITFAEAV